jgi:hypothetical protein
MLETDAQTVAQQQPAAPPRRGEPCEECGAPLAADQRYCLECGRRRGGPRVDYRHYMGAAPASAEAPSAGAGEEAPAAEQPAKPQRDYAPLAAVGGIAVLGLMLLVGVLIGKGNSNTASTPATQVVRVPASGAESSGAGTGGSSKGSGGKSASGGGKKAKAHGGGAANTGAAVKKSSGELEALSNESGSDYEKQSKELPNEIATPGAPPPIDKSVAPGGGEGGGETIK